MLIYKHPYIIYLLCTNDLWQITLINGLLITLADTVCSNVIIAVCCKTVWINGEILRGLIIVIALLTGTSKFAHIVNQLEATQPWMTAWTHTPRSLLMSSLGCDWHRYVECVNRWKDMMYLETFPQITDNTCSFKWVC